MTIGIPAKVAPLLLTRALSYQLFVYAAFLLITAEISLVAMGIDARAWAVSYAVGLLVIPGLALTALMFFSRRPWVVGLYIITEVIFEVLVKGLAKKPDLVVFTTEPLAFKTILLAF